MITTTVTLKRFVCQKAGERKNEITKEVCLQEKKRPFPDYKPKCDEELLAFRN